MPQRAPRRHAQRGQSLVIFALVATVLFAVVGMGVDGGFSYFASDKLERGAMAGALAGVPDMPDFNASPNDATTAAIAAVAKNGWTAGGTNNVAITVAQVTDPNTGQPYRNRLAVTVASDVPAFFMRLLGIQSHREARTAVAEYLRPITFGQPGSQLGSSLNNLGTAGNFYFMRSEGWGTDRGQGDAYGPNPTDWGGAHSSAPADTHALSGSLGTEPATQPFALPQRGGQNYQVYIPPGQQGVLDVYNPVFAPDNQTTVNGFNYHEDDSDFPETGTCGPGTGPCSGPASVKQWPVMSYTVYRSPNPFDHTGDVWLSNMTIKSIDSTANATATGANNPAATYKIMGAGAALPMSGLTLYHNWVDINSQSSMTAADKNLTTVTQSTPTDVLTGAAGTGTTYRVRVDQLDNNNGDPGANGLANNQNSQAHKGYAVGVMPSGGGCATLAAGCSVAALDDVTLYTPIKAGGSGSMPLVSIPPEYSGRTFSLYIYDPGDVGCIKPNQCSNVVTVMRPNGGCSPACDVAATNSDGVFAGGPSEQAGGFNLVPGTPVGGNASLQTQDPAANPANIYNGDWVRFDIQIPANYETADVTATDPNTWFWELNYSTALAASDTITANLGFTGAPVHLIQG